MNIDVHTSRDTNLLTGEEVVRVKYRAAGHRRWTRILVFPDETQTVDELMRQGNEIAAAHLDSQSRVRAYPLPEGDPK